MANLLPYRPSNGTEGEIFYSAWCRHCVREQAFRADPEDAEGCSIYALSMAFAIDHPSYPQEWVRNDRGPGCLSFQEEGTDGPLDPNAVVRPLL